MPHRAPKLRGWAKHLSATSVELLLAVERDDADGVLTAIQEGADANIIRGEGVHNSILHSAAEQRCGDALIALLRHQPKPFLLFNDQNETALHVCAQYTATQMTLPLLVLAYGLSTDVDVQGNTVLHRLMQNSNLDLSALISVTEWLLRHHHGTQLLNVRNKAWQSVIDVAVAREEPAVEANLHQLLLQFGAKQGFELIATHKEVLFHDERKLRNGIIVEQETAWELVVQHWRKQGELMRRVEKSSRKKMRLMERERNHREEIKNEADSMMTAILRGLALEQSIFQGLGGMQRELDGVARIQATWRKFAKKQEVTLIRKQSDCAMKIQRIYRGHLARKEYNREKLKRLSAILLIQRHVRRFIRRKKIDQMRVSREWAGMASVDRKRMRAVSNWVDEIISIQNQAAIIITNLLRTKAIRNQYLKQRKQFIAVQAVWRMKRAQKEKARRRVYREKIDIIRDLLKQRQSMNLLSAHIDEVLLHRMKKKVETTAHAVGKLLCWESLYVSFEKTILNRMLLKQERDQQGRPMEQPLHATQRRHPLVFSVTDCFLEWMAAFLAFVGFLSMIFVPRKKETRISNTCDGIIIGFLWIRLLFTSKFNNRGTHQSRHVSLFFDLLTLLLATIAAACSYYHAVICYTLFILRFPFYFLFLTADGSTQELSQYIAKGIQYAMYNVCLLLPLIAGIGFASARSVALPALFLTSGANIFSALCWLFRGDAAIQRFSEFTVVNTTYAGEALNNGSTSYYSNSSWSTLNTPPFELLQTSRPFEITLAELHPIRDAQAFNTSFTTAMFPLLPLLAPQILIPFALFVAMVLGMTRALKESFEAETSMDHCFSKSNYVEKQKRVQFVPSTAAKKNQITSMGFQGEEKIAPRLLSWDPEIDACQDILLAHSSSIKEITTSGADETTIVVEQPLMPSPSKPVSLSGMESPLHAKKDRLFYRSTKNSFLCSVEDSLFSRERREEDPPDTIEGILRKKKSGGSSGDLTGFDPHQPQTLSSPISRSGSFDRLKSGYESDGDVVIVRSVEEESLALPHHHRSISTSDKHKVGPSKHALNLDASDSSTLPPYEGHRHQVPGAATEATPAAIDKPPVQSAPVYLWNCLHENYYYQSRFDHRLSNNAVTDKKYQSKLFRFFSRQWFAPIFKREMTYLILVNVCLSYVFVGTKVAMPLEIVFGILYGLELIIGCILLSFSACVTHNYHLSFQLRLWGMLVGLVPNLHAFAFLRAVRFFEGWGFLFCFASVHFVGLFLMLFLSVLVFLIGWTAVLQSVADEYASNSSEQPLCNVNAGCATLILESFLRPNDLIFQQFPRMVIPLAMISLFRFVLVPLMLVCLCHPILGLASFANRLLHLALERLRSDVSLVLDHITETALWFSHRRFTNVIPRRVMSGWKEARDVLVRHYHLRVERQFPKYMRPRKFNRDAVAIRAVETDDPKPKILATIAAKAKILLQKVRQRLRRTRPLKLLQTRLSPFLNFSLPLEMIFSRRFTFSVPLVAGNIYRYELTQRYGGPSWRGRFFELCFLTPFGNMVRSHYTHFVYLIFILSSILCLWLPVRESHEDFSSVYGPLSHSALGITSIVVFSLTMLLAMLMVPRNSSGFLTFFVIACMITSLVSQFQVHQNSGEGTLYYWRLVAHLLLLQSQVMLLKHCQRAVQLLCRVAVYYFPPMLIIGLLVLLVQSFRVMIDDDSAFSEAGGFLRELEMLFQTNRQTLYSLFHYWCLPLLVLVVFYALQHFTREGFLSLQHQNLHSLSFILKHPAMRTYRIFKARLLDLFFPLFQFVLIVNCVFISLVSEHQWETFNEVELVCGIVFLSECNIRVIHSGVQWYYNSPDGHYCSQRRGLMGKLFFFEVLDLVFVILSFLGLLFETGDIIESSVGVSFLPYSLFLKLRYLRLIRLLPWGLKITCVQNFHIFVVASGIIVAVFCVTAAMLTESLPPSTSFWQWSYTDSLQEAMSSLLRFVMSAELPRDIDSSSTMDLPYQLPSKLTAVVFDVLQTETHVTNGLNLTLATSHNTSALYHFLVQKYSGDFASSSLLNLHYQESTVLQQFANNANTNNYLLFSPLLELKDVIGFGSIAYYAFLRIGENVSTPFIHNENNESTMSSNHHHFHPERENVHLTPENIVSQLQDDLFSGYEGHFFLAPRRIIIAALVLKALLAIVLGYLLHVVFASGMFYCHVQLPPGAKRLYLHLMREYRESAIPRWRVPFILEQLSIAHPAQQRNAYHLLLETTVWLEIYEKRQTMVNAYKEDWYNFLDGGSIGKEETEEERRRGSELPTYPLDAEAVYSSNIRQSITKNKSHLQNSMEDGKEEKGKGEDNQEGEKEENATVQQEATATTTVTPKPHEKKVSIQEEKEKEKESEPSRHLNCPPIVCPRSSEQVDCLRLVQAVAAKELGYPISTSIDAKLWQDFFTQQQRIRAVLMFQSTFRMYRVIQWLEGNALTRYARVCLKYFRKRFKLLQFKKKAEFFSAHSINEAFQRHPRACFNATEPQTRYMMRIRDHYDLISAKLWVRPVVDTHVVNLRPEVLDQTKAAEPVRYPKFGEFVETSPQMSSLHDDDDEESQSELLSPTQPGGQGMSATYAAPVSEQQLYPFQSQKFVLPTSTDEHGPMAGVMSQDGEGAPSSRAVNIASPGGHHSPVESLPSISASQNELGAIMASRQH